MHDLAELRPHLLDEIEHFFNVYKMLEPDARTQTRGYEGRAAALARDRGVPGEVSRRSTDGGQAAVGSTANAVHSSA